MHKKFNDLKSEDANFFKLLGIKLNLSRRKEFLQKLPKTGMIDINK